MTIPKECELLKIISSFALPHLHIFALPHSLDPIHRWNLSRFFVINIPQTVAPPVGIVDKTLAAEIYRTVYIGCIPQCLNLPGNQG
jgi:hypothetical protein